jgi:hypothetical protein
MREESEQGIHRNYSKTQLIIEEIREKKLLESMWMRHG